MRRRFGRRRGGRGGEENGAELDAGRWLERLAASGLMGDARFEPVALEGIAGTSVVLAASPDDQVLGFSPHDAGDALFGALALAQARAAESGFAGTAWAVAPFWSESARRRLGLLRTLPYRLRALAASQLADDPGAVTPASPDHDLAVAPEQIAASIERPEERDLFGRVLVGLQGLAAKHGGSVRGVGRRAELVLFARRAACVEAGESGGLRLVIDPPDRTVLELSLESLASALDRLEGSLRKQLSDRRIRTSEEGQRAGLLRVLERAAGLRRGVLWPHTGSEPARIDWIGVGAGGEAIAASARERLTLAGLGEILDASLDAVAQLGAWLPDGPVPLRQGPPRLVLAAAQFDPAALHVLGALALQVDGYDVRTRRSGDLELERREAPVAPPLRAETRIAAPPPAARAPQERPEPRPEPVRSQPARPEPEARPSPRFEHLEAFDLEGEPEAPRFAREPEDAADEAAEAPAEGGGGRFEEVSLFDLEEEAPAQGASAAGRRRRRGGRRRGRRGRGDGGAPYSGDGSPAREGGEPAQAAPREERGARGRGEPRGEPGEPREREREREPQRERARSAGDEDEVDDEAGLELAEAPELEEEASPALPAYEDEEEGEEREEPSDQERERELRRRARLAKTVEPISRGEPPRPQRRRAAFVAHADRVSVLTAVLLARDVRMVEGFWVYPQQDLMTFFRSIATDLRDDTPIFVVGFAASPPARDTIHAAALYRGRMEWFDHHPWPPEDVVALREAIGADSVHIEPGADMSLPLIISERTRRSRFSDKLVDLITGRFSQHDYERWGRHWWHRAGEVAAKRGERRGDIEALLVGRPSELARHAASLPPPPPPAELAFAASRDFRLVHFGGYTLVVVDVPPEHDLHLAARIARERYDALLSLAYRHDGELLVLGGDESRVRRSLDLAGMAEHLASKHDWIRALPDADHVARMLVRGLASDPNRLEEVIAEVAMGRSIVEG